MALFLGKAWPVFIRTKGLHSGDALNTITGNLGSYGSVTAAGTTQADALPLSVANVEVASGSANNAGVLLPPSYPGLIINVLNNSLNTTKIYPYGTDQIQNAGTTYAAASVAVTQATLVSSQYICVKTGFWQRVITS